MLTFSSDITGKEISLAKTISKVEAINIVLVSVEICLNAVLLTIKTQMFSNDYFEV